MAGKNYIWIQHCLYSRIITPNVWVRWIKSEELRFVHCFFFLVVQAKTPITTGGTNEAFDAYHFFFSFSEKNIIHIGRGNLSCSILYHVFRLGWKKYFVVFGCGLETDGFWRINPNNKVETNPLRFIMMKVTRKGIIYHKQKVNTRAIQCDHSDELEPRLAASTNSSMGKAGRFHGWPKPRASRQRHRFRASRGMTVRVWKIPNIRQTQTKGS